MADFARALPKVLRNEGVIFDHRGRPIPGHTGWVDHPDDPGGETNFGITEDVAVANGYIDLMKDMPYSFAVRVYRSRYWDKIHGDDIADQRLAEELFDTAVNIGVERTSRYLQRTLNVLNKKGKLYDDLRVDGIIGDRTLSVLFAALAISPWYLTVILRAVDALQAVWYIELSERDEDFETFTPGWLRTRVG